MALARGTERLLAPSSRMVVIDDAGHFLHLEKPAEVNDHILTWVSSSPAAAAPPWRRQRANLSMAAWVTGVKKLTRLPSGSRNSSDRLPHGIVVGSLTKSSTKPARFRCTPSTSSTRNSMMTVLLSHGQAAPGANSGTVPVLAIAGVASRS